MYGAAQQIIGALTKINERQDRLEYAQNNAKRNRKAEADLAFARSQGYTGKKADELFQWMADNDCGNVHIAVRELGSASGDMWGSMADDLKPLIENGGNDESWLRKKINETLQEVRSGGDY
jgi:hypothetical protein